MGQILVLPLVGILFLGIGMQLIDIAEASGEKVVSFAEDMDGAIDCAFRGIPIEKCSPNLGNNDLKDDLEEYKNLLNETITKED